MAEKVCECLSTTGRRILSIKQYVNVYMLVRDAEGKPVKRNKTEYKTRKFGRYHLFNRPPMMYMDMKLSSGEVMSVPFQRTGPDEYCEYLKGDKDGDNRSRSDG